MDERQKVVPAPVSPPKPAHTPASPATPPKKPTTSANPAESTPRATRGPSEMWLYLTMEQPNPAGGRHERVVLWVATRANMSVDEVKQEAGAHLDGIEAEAVVAKPENAAVKWSFKACCRFYRDKCADWTSHPRALKWKEDQERYPNRAPQY